MPVVNLLLNSHLNLLKDASYLRWCIPDLSVTKCEAICEIIGSTLRKLNVKNGLMNGWMD